MGKPTDQAALDAYRHVLLNLGHVTGYIQWKQTPAQWLYANLPNATIKFVHEQMVKYVRGGGKIDQQKETRSEYLHWRFHYDLRLPVANQRVYIETVFQHEPDPEDCTIWIVNMHDV